MQVAILYTAFRQFEELIYLPQAMSRQPWLRGNVDIIYHCNNPGISKVQLEERLIRVPCRSLKVICSDKNCGYGYGQFEAISEIWEHLRKLDCDWVIHLHPDIYIVDEEPLLNALRSADKIDAPLVVTKIFGLRHPSFATDFFAFRPRRIPKELFESYLCFVGMQVIVPLENLFYIDVHRHGVSYHLAERFLYGRYFRDVDKLGLWHEHRLARVRLYYSWGEALRWWITFGRIFRQPYLSLRITIDWLVRRARKVRQDSLAKQLTVT